jgi:hypothetical protein
VIKATIAILYLCVFLPGLWIYCTAKQSPQEGFFNGLVMGTTGSGLVFSLWPVLKEMFHGFMKGFTG